MRRCILTLLVLSATGCGITGPDKVTLQVAGTVTAQATGQPVGGALIELFPPCFLFCNDQGRATTTTDAQGHYSVALSVDDPCTGNGFGFEIRASFSGFEAMSEQVECKGSLQHFDFSLAPPALTLTAASRARR